MSKEYIERKKAVAVVRAYGKDAISSGKKKLDTVDDLIKIIKQLYEIPAANSIDAE